MSRLHQLAFGWLAKLGAPVGGVRPRRIYNWLADRAHPEPPTDAAEFRWVRDRWGHRFLLHPYYHLDRQIIAFGSYEPDAMRFMHSILKPGMVCLDVGANLGEITVNMAACVQPGGQVHAFEPVPEVAGRLRQHVTANDLDEVVEVHRVALSNENGTTSIHFADPSVRNQGMAALSPTYEWLDNAITVETVRLDDFVATHGLERIDLIKIDVQGAEPLLFEGAQRTFADLRPDLLVEVSPIDLRAFGSGPRQLLEPLVACGYRLFDLGSKRLIPRAFESIGPEFAADNLYCTMRDLAA